MTGGDDILYLITLRNLEIHLVIGLCCFEVCFGTGLLMACNGTHHLKVAIIDLLTVYDTLMSTQSVKHVFYHALGTFHNLQSGVC